MNDAIDFDRIDKYGPQACSGTFDLSPAELLRDEVIGLGSVVIEARADKGGQPGEYAVDGSARFTADLTCSRCVEPYPFANDSTFHVRFRPRPELSGEENEEVEIGDAQDLDVEFYSDRTIPLKDLALEQIQLSIPMKPLCDESCLGLCPVCGRNRSREACECETGVVDARWDALSGLRDQLGKKDV